VAVILVAAPATADWDPGDPYKMHYPQLPDPEGWDVNFSPPLVPAGDWLCTRTGPVSDIHFWFSSQLDRLDWIRFQEVQMKRQTTRSSK
jgi:hypothetical protein